MMEILFLFWEYIGLFLYSICKAFLPLPSLEVILVPLVIHHPSYWLIYSLIGAVGTFIGGAIGYWLAYWLQEQAFSRFAVSEDINKGKALLKKHGLWAVFIGGITPIPDFLLAYLAGFVKMPFFSFAMCDAIARFLRSVIVAWGLLKLQIILPMDRYGTILSFGIMLVLFLRWFIQKWKLSFNTSKK